MSEDTNEASAQHTNSQLQNFSKTIKDATLAFPKIMTQGALVFDIDETLLEPDASLRHAPKVKSLIAEMLRMGLRLAFVSGGPGAVVDNRMIKELIGELGPQKSYLKNLTLYVNGGGNKFTFDGQGRWIEDKDYLNKSDRITGECLRKLQATLTTYLRRQFDLDHETFELLKVGWLKKRNRQWNGLQIEFDDGWMQGDDWQISLWDDHEMANVKAGHQEGKVSFPFINIRSVKRDASGQVEEVSGMTPAGLYTLHKGTGDSVDLDIRDWILEQLEKDFKECGDLLSMRKAGRSSIDIVEKNMNKAVALKDYIETEECQASRVYYFGDEFFSGGNDQPIAGDQELKEMGLRILALNKTQKPTHAHVSWIGSSPLTTVQFLQEIIKRS